MAQLRPGVLAAGAARTARARPQRLDALDDDLFAALEPQFDDGVGPALATDLEAPDHRLAVLDDKDIECPAGQR